MALAPENVGTPEKPHAPLLICSDGFTWFRPQVWKLGCPISPIAEGLLPDIVQISNSMILATREVTNIRHPRGGDAAARPKSLSLRISMVPGANRSDQRC